MADFEEDSVFTEGVRAFEATDPARFDVLNNTIKPLVDRTRYLHDSVDELKQFESDLANPDKGAAMVARGVVAVDSVVDLLALPAGQRKTNLRYMVRGYHAGSGVGGGEFYFDPGRADENDGGTVLDGFVRVRSNNIDVDWFGVVRGDFDSDQFDRFEKFINAIRDGDSVVLRGGFKCVLPYALSLAKGDLEIKSDNQPIILAFSPAMSAADAGAAISIRTPRSIVSHLCFDGHRASNGPGTSATVPSTGQGGLVMIGGDYEGAVFDHCTFQHSIYPGVVTGDYVQNLTFRKCRWPDSGEHHVYLSAGYKNITFEEPFFGNNGMNPDQGGRLCTDIKIRSLVGFPQGLKIKDGEKNQSEVVSGMMHGVIQSAQGGFGCLEVDGMEFENTHNIYQGLLSAVSLAPGEVVDGAILRRVRNGPPPLGNLLASGSTSSNDRLLKGLVIEDYSLEAGRGVSNLFAFDKVDGLRINGGTASTANSSLTDRFRCEGTSVIRGLVHLYSGTSTPLRICPSFRSAIISGEVRLADGASVTTMALIYDEFANSLPSHSVKLDLDGLDVIAGEETASNSIQFGATSATTAQIRASGVWDRRFGFLSASAGVYDITLEGLDLQATTEITAPDRARSLRSLRCSRNLSWYGLVTVPSGSTTGSVTADPLLAYSPLAADVEATPVAGFPGSWYADTTGRGTIRVRLEEPKPHDVVFSVRVDLAR